MFLKSSRWINLISEQDMNMPERALNHQDSTKELLRNWSAVKTWIRRIGKSFFVQHGTEHHKQMSPNQISANGFFHQDVGWKKPHTMAAIAVGVEVTSVSYGARHQSLWQFWYELSTHIFLFSQWFLWPKINDLNIKIPKEFFPFGNKISKIYSKPRKLHTLVASLIASVFSFC